MSKTAGNFSGRADRLAALFGEREITHLLITDPINVRYMCGFTGTNGLCLAGDDLRVFYTDFRYVERAEQELREFELKQAGRELLKEIGKLLGARSSVRLGFDDAQMSVRQHARLEQAMPASIELVAAGDLVERLRAIKDEDELRAVREAAAIATSALEQVVEAGLKGRTEAEVAKQVLEEVIDAGGEEVSFPVIVAAAENGALPHAEPRDVAIPEDTLVTIDLGAKLEGYCSDMTRTFATGALAEQAELIYTTTLAAQEAALAAVAADAECKAVDGVARELIAGAGYGKNFGHGLGHGVGLKVHEGPTLSARSEGRLELGNVVTVEPGIYLPGRFGVRIEDLVAITEGGVENLSTYPKELIVVD